ncbi:Serine/threonine-protein kinase [Podospora fimiseda]|uniref:non-specific serine/threonine protein kinase n=1 Tax=Podospora fimiseda TaxID=252190 RepID=A0AAN7GYN0_9PEZI|nr:Serine/threonine-protein kinase [Podospora fimiseda]
MSQSTRRIWSPCKDMNLVVTTPSGSGIASRTDDMPLFTSSALGEKKFVAIKIAVASSHQDSNELEILSRIKSQPKGHQGKNFVHILLDSFVHYGPNGTHRCFVNLHMGNILLALPDISSLSVDELCDMYGAPNPEPSVRSDGKPIHPNCPPFVLPGVWFGKACEKVMLSDSNIIATDFGESWQPSLRTRYHLNIPYMYRAPETLFAEKENRAISFPADGDIFECLFPDSDDVFAENIGMLGKSPTRWWDIWDAKHNFFNEEGDWELKNGRIAEGICRLLERRGITAEELRDLLDLLEQIFRWLPEDRVTAEELANGTWMKKWGLPWLELAQKSRG